MEAVPATELETLLAETDWLARLALSLTGDPETAEDLAQETWLTALRRPPARAASPRPWLATVARNAARYDRRSAGARRDRESARARDLGDDAAPAPEELLVRAETQEELSRLVRELPSELSEVLMLTYFEGRTSAWIARRRGIPAATVRARKQRALELLRERLDTRHGGDRQAWLSALAPLAATAARRGAVPAASGGLLAGLLAPWIAMSFTWKLVSLLGVSLLAALPFLTRSDVRPAPQSTTGGVGVPEVALAPAPAPELVEAPPAAPAAVAVERAPAPAAVAAAAEDGPPVTRVRLRVVDERGRPVSRATVSPSLSLELESAHAFLEAELGPLRMLTLQAEMLRRTGADGFAAWETDLLREAGMVDFNVEGPKYEVGTLRVELEPGMDEDLGEVVLVPAGVVSGTLYTRTGEDPGRQVVELGPVELPADESALEGLRRRGPGETTGYVTSREDGRFELSGIPPGEYRAYARAPGLERGRGGWSAPLVVTAGFATEGVEIEVERATRPEGEILVLGVDGEPLTTARVRIEREGYTYSGGVNDEGRYVLGQSYAYLAGGRATITDDSLAHRTAVVEPMPDEPQTVVVQLEAAETEEHTLQLRGLDGSAVTEADVTVKGLTGARSWNGVANAVQLLVPADAEGAFELFVRARGFAPAKLEGLTASELPGDWLLELEPQRGIRGIVLSGGEPLEKAKLELRWQVDAGRVELDGTAVNRVQGYAVDEVRTDTEGRFVIHGDLDGDLALVVTRRGHADRTLLLTGYLAAEGWPELVVELDEGGTVSGTVVDHTGAPVRGASVVLDHPLYALRSARTKRDGTYRFRRVAAGDWYARVVDEVHDGFFTYTAELPEDWEYPVNCTTRAGEETRLDLVLADPEATSIGGRVSVRGLESGTVRAHVETADAGPFRGTPFVESWEAAASLDGEGAFEVRLREGRNYRLELEVPGLASRPHREVSAAELPVWIELELDLAELVLTRAGEQPEVAVERNVHVAWRSGEWVCYATFEPDAEGGFAPVRVPSGAVELTWKSADGTARSRTVQVAAVDPAEVVLD